MPKKECKLCDNSAIIKVRYKYADPNLINSTFYFCELCGIEVITNSIEEIVSDKDDVAINIIMVK